MQARIRQNSRNASRYRCINGAQGGARPCFASLDKALDEHNALVARFEEHDPKSSASDRKRVGIKDNLCTEGTRTSAGSVLLSQYVPPYDASCVARVQKSSDEYTIFGKTNLDEFAMGSSTELSAFGATVNPHDTARVPGGSSGGSAAAVASGTVDIALGSDTGGSIRQPAAFCGVVGLKPTYGRVPRHGLVAFASSLDTIGPISNSVADSAHLLDTIAGADGFDCTALSAPETPFTQALLDESELNWRSKPLHGTTIGVLDFSAGVDQRVKDCVDTAAHELEALGASTETVTLSSIEDGLAAYHIIAPSEASSNLARYDGLRYGSRTQQSASRSLPQSAMTLRPLDEAASDAAADIEASSSAPTLSQAYAEARAMLGPEVTRRILTGTYTLSAGYTDQYYARAQQVRALLQQELANVLERTSAIVMPTTPTVAFGLGEKRDNPLALLAGDVLTAPANLVGAPAISVPCGTVDSMPVGMQLLGRQEGEHDILRIAHAYEQCRSR